MTHRAILIQTLQCLSPHRKPHWGDHTPLDVFNRLLAKNVRAAGWTDQTHCDIREEEITSRQEAWTTDALGRLPRAHTEVAPQDWQGPIVLVEFEGMLRLIDGNHRINRWVAFNDDRTHLRQHPHCDSKNEGRFRVKQPGGSFGKKLNVIKSA